MKQLDKADVTFKTGKRNSILIWDFIGAPAVNYTINSSRQSHSVLRAGGYLHVQSVPAIAQATPCNYEDSGRFLADMRDTGPIYQVTRWS